MSTNVFTRVLMIGWCAPAFVALNDHQARVATVIEARHLGDAQAHDPDGTFVVVPDTGDAEQVLAGLARARIALDGFDVVCTIGEFPLVAAALLAEQSKAVGMRVSTAIALRDKFVQKRLVREAGLPVAQARVANLLSDLDGEQLTYPIVVKPLTGAGAKDTHIVSNPLELESLAAGDQKSRRGPWLVEEFIEGEELHLDGVVRSGAIRALSVSRYVQNVIDIKSGGLVGSAVIDPDQSPDLYAKAEALVSAALEAFGHGDGIFHAEAFEKDGTLVFSECGGRLGGGMIQETVLRRFGVNLSDEWARAVLDLPPGQPAQPSTLQCGWIQLPAPVGVAQHVPQQSEVLEQPGCLEATIILTPGSETPDFSTASNVRAGRVVVGGASEEQVRERLLALAAWFSDSVVVQAGEPA
ncbi:acetyl-CoA carboxylase biotin carboxylase subunit family protein [Streptomyces sp. NPDC001678]|uniref:ATP-grasp domain-containing protein n=1 Tax=Streptomyces sp. NPDC001678 TaxID=3364599 RepID=UPI00369E0A43